ncbi:MAG: acetoacetate decarboxylase [Bacteroidetes bacterium]|nr:MAG: acetoacetate decarboxylase [Bacteroidota bacterium]
MPLPKRIRRQAGRHALVDGIPFQLPINSEQTPALMAGFPIDADRAAALMPGNELHPFRLWNGKGLLIITVIDYRVTDIGKYIEFSIGLACTRGPRPAPRMLPGLLMNTFGTGQFVYDLPVSTEISVKGGKGIWGMPKHQANLDFVITDTTVSSQYDKEGQFAMKIEIDRPHSPTLRLRNIGMKNYCQFRGMLMKSYIYFSGSIQLSLFGKARARLILGDHPHMQPLKTLGIEDAPLFTAFMPETRGILDDYFECWFLTYDRPPAAPPEGLESVADLGLGQEWLAPPNPAWPALHPRPATASP